MILDLWGKVVSEWCKHCDKSIALVCQGKETKFVKEDPSVGDGGKQPVNVVFINTLREKSNNTEEVTSIGAKFMEHWGGK